jgi:hypothetical protein
MKCATFKGTAGAVRLSAIAVDDLLMMSELGREGAKIGGNAVWTP